MTPNTQLDFRNENSLWGSVLAETLARLGLTHAVLSPGSRSTALTMALARHPHIACVPVLDERSAAFFALGLARRTHRPVALVCTSGTAGANYHSAVIEAQESNVPLLVLTADRPPEMRACRSGQTIDQQKMFGSHVNFYHELAAPAATAGLLRYLRQTVAHAWERTQWPVAGPVHLNAPFRDPLAPIEDGTTAALAGDFDERRFFSGLKTAPASGRSGAATRELGRVLRPVRTGRGLIVAGPAQPADPAGYARAVAGLAHRLGWPVLADALSPLRNHVRAGVPLVTSYDLIARSERWREELRPAHVLCLNDWPASKALRQWLEATDAPTTVVSPQAQNPDSLHGRTTWLHGRIEEMARGVAAGPRPPGWLGKWQAVDRGLRRRLARELAAVDWMFEGRASALLPGALPAGTAVFVANSMPVRDAEYFWPANRRGHAMYCNRGANGIDGTLSTALGLAHGGGPAVLLTGDLALLHDTNGFLQARRMRGSLTVVLINNNGGGIFEHLPVARFEPPFEEFFATPQNANFRGICAAYGVPHVRVTTWRQFGRLLRAAPRRGIRVLELRTDRKRDAAFRPSLLARLAASPVTAREAD